nr:MAG TPA: hypothetical protein [Caudoviricetes sp.]
MKPTFTINVIHKQTLRKTVYKNVKFFKDFNDLEFIIEEIDGTRHHFPTKHYDYIVDTNKNSEYNLKNGPIDLEKSHVRVAGFVFNGSEYFDIDNVVKIERKWNNNLYKFAIYIHSISKASAWLTNDITNIIVFAESDVKSIRIQKSEEDDLTIIVNGGTYRDE